MNRISISHVSNRHNDWLRALEFYTQELMVIKTRLTEIAGKNTNTDMLQQVEHYENQLKIQNDQLQQLEHNIKGHITSLARQAAESKAGYVDGVLLKEQEQLEAACLQEEDIINKLRHEFNRFAAKWM